MRMFLKMSAISLALVFAQVASADNFGGQVFYHGGMAKLNKSRGGQVFTDAGGATTRNDDDSGWNMGAGVDLPLIKEMGPGDVLGEIMVDYSRFARERVTQASSVLLGGSGTERITISSLNVLIAPKYQFKLLSGKLRPWIIPIGLSFLVNSPPTNNVSYLDIGYHVAVGVEYALIDNLSLGLAYRNTFSAHEIDIDTSYSTFDIYAGINF